MSNVPTTPPVASIGLNFPVWIECVETYSAIIRSYKGTTCAEIWIRPGAGKGDGWIKDRGYIACGGQTYWRDSEEKFTYILPSRTTGPTGQCIGDLCLRLKVHPGGGCERQHNVG